MNSLFDLVSGRPAFCHSYNFLCIFNLIYMLRHVTVQILTNFVFTCSVNHSHSLDNGRAFSFLAHTPSTLVGLLPSGIFDFEFSPLQKWFVIYKILVQYLIIVPLTLPMVHISSTICIVKVVLFYEAFCP